ncbi:MAG: diguanylate cyclase [Bacillaceae bacterium]|nr:diguanylate cyclase [Bacillaceae bacterium]
MMIIYAFILTMLFKVQTYIGSIIFILMVVLMADNYKRYFHLLEKLKEKANCDELTGIYNHRYFQQALKEELKKAGTDHSLSVLFLDIDHFKKYNDTYGHQVGDQVLQQFAGIVASNLPEKAIFARYGGEEFVVLLPDTDSREAYNVAENIRKKIQKASFTGMSVMPYGCLTVSIGLSTYPEISPDGEALVRNADQALYAAKRLGRNKSKIYSIKTDAPKDVAALRSDQELHQLVDSLMSMLKNKDLPTYDHSMRVCQYALAFAEWLNLSSEDRRTLEFGAILHDLGKMEIPREILNKKDSLLDHEWEWVKKHSEYGESLLKNIPELKSILPLVRHHHERYDGKGYPDGLKGEEIPFLTRLLTIVDSFDAMTTNRGYQQTKTYNEAIEELSRCASTQFDPYLLEEFIKMLEKIRDQEHGMLEHVEGV